MDGWTDGWTDGQTDKIGKLLTVILRLRFVARVNMGGKDNKVHLTSPLFLLKYHHYLKHSKDVTCTLFSLLPLFVDCFVLPSLLHPLIHSIVFYACNNHYMKAIH